MPEGYSQFEADPEVDVQEAPANDDVQNERDISPEELSRAEAISTEIAELMPEFLAAQKEYTEAVSFRGEYLKAPGRYQQDIRQVEYRIRQAKKPFFELSAAMFKLEEEWAQIVGMAHNEELDQAA